MRPSRLLLVDDEPALADLLRRYLERLGYAVDSFTQPAEALASVAADPARYALLVTDLTLPGIDGEELLLRMRVHNPAMPAIIASGYPYEPRSKGVTFVQKPFLPRMLAEEIERLLAG
jgi:DNA-binding NtrC family response regulator